MIKNYNFRKCNLRNVHFLLLLITLLCTSGLYAQSTGDYRSNTTVGNWTALTSWQRFNGTSWVTPTAAQGYPGNIQEPELLPFYQDIKSMPILYLILRLQPLL